MTSSDPLPAAPAALRLRPRWALGILREQEVLYGADTPYALAA